MNSKGIALVFVPPHRTHKTMQVYHWLRAKGFNVSARAQDVIVTEDMIPRVAGTARVLHDLHAAYVTTGDRIDDLRAFARDVYLGNVARTYTVYGIATKSDLGRLHLALNAYARIDDYADRPKNPSLSSVYFHGEFVFCATSEEDLALFGVQE